MILLIFLESHRIEVDRDQRKDHKLMFIEKVVKFHLLYHYPRSSEGINITRFNMMPNYVLRA